MNCFCSYFFFSSFIIFNGHKIIQH
jgi:hypothetical protein